MSVTANLARAVLVDTFFADPFTGPKRRWPIYAGLALAGLAIFRWRAAHDMRVPLDLAFKHPFTPITKLYRQMRTVTTHPEWDPDLKVWWDTITGAVMDMQIGVVKQPIVLRADLKRQQIAR